MASPDYSFKRCGTRLKMTSWKRCTSSVTFMLPTIQWLNSANVVLLRKKDGAEGIGDYRPISHLATFMPLPRYYQDDSNLPWSSYEQLISKPKVLPLSTFTNVLTWCTCMCATRCEAQCAYLMHMYQGPNLILAMLTIDLGLLHHRSPSSVHHPNCSEAADSTACLLRVCSVLV